MATRYRRFAHRSPRAYQLLFGAAGAAPSPATNALAAAGVLRVAEALVGQAEALEAARLLVAFAHGFVSMELAGAFRLGGNVDAAFDYGLDALIGADGSADPVPPDADDLHDRRTSRRRAGRSRRPPTSDGRHPASGRGWMRPGSSGEPPEPSAGRAVARPAYAR